MAVLSIILLGLNLLLVQAAAPANIEAFAQECLKSHNTYRAKHQAPPLTLNSTISAVSQEWADHILSTGTMSHRPNNIYGENIYGSPGTDPNYKVNCSQAVDMWYNEVSKYKYGSGFSSDTGHFTQLVWKSSKQLGVGFAVSNGKNYVVCNYSPPGNYEGQFVDNVLQPKR